MWKEIMPPECEKVVREYERSAGEIRAIASRVRSAGVSIDQSWICPAKNVFNDSFGPMPRRLEEYADQLHRTAQAIRNIRVRVWEP
jgi:uncharacterized protein YukE